MDITSLLSQVNRLPPNPQVMLKLMKLLQDMDTGTYQIVNLIKVDTSLTAQILRIANSAFYGATEPTHDLEVAVNRIGFRETYKLVGAICSNQLLVGLPPPVYPGSDQLWEQTTAIALLMEDLSPRLGLETSSTYTIGLLHSLGKIVISQTGKYGEIFGIVEKESLLLADAETRVLGFTHADVAAALLKKWNTPPDILAPVRNQMNPMKEPDQMNAACALHAAICTVQGTTTIPGRLTRDARTYYDAVTQLGIGNEELDAAYLNIQPRLENIKKLLITGAPPRPKA
jgi:HD-like signal output (HDOD) protein